MYNLDLPDKLFEYLLVPRETITPSQIEIFSVIVALLYVLAFEDQTPSQSEIFSELTPARSQFSPAHSQLATAHSVEYYK